MRSSTSSDDSPSSSNDSSSSLSQEAGYHPARPGPLPQRPGVAFGVALPKTVKRRWNESRSHHIRRMARNAHSKLNRERKKRRNIRSALGTNNKELLSAVQSSSEEEEEYGSEEELEDAIDVQHLAHHTWWGSQCIFSAMPVREISSLVGWATHLTHSGEQTIVSDTAPLINSPCSANLQNYPRNPLLFLPYVPQRTSFLYYISGRTDEILRKRTQRIQYMLREQANYTTTWERQSLLCNSDVSDGGGGGGDVGRNRKRRREHKNRWSSCQQRHWQMWTYDSDDEDYQILKRSRRSNMVESIVLKNSPSKLSTQPMSGGKDTAKIIEVQLIQSFDQTALVALGSLLEESMTASLLPLAQLHVDRCRKLEQLKSQENGRNSPGNEIEMEIGGKRISDPFHEWTLPPVEALMKLMKDYSIPEHSSSLTSCCRFEDGKVPSALPATRVNRRWFPNGDYGETSIADSIVDQLPLFSNFTRNQREETSVLNWCQIHGLSSSFVNENMDLYRLFLPFAPANNQSPSVDKED